MTPIVVNKILFESRRNQRESEWKLDKLSPLNALERLDFKPEIDSFAPRLNHQCSNYVSYRPDPEALAIDAYSLDWSNLNLYAFPPLSVIPLNSEWKLDKLSLLNALERLDFKPEIDSFAPRLNHQCSNYVSYRPDPEALAIDAKSLDCSNLNL